MTIFLVYLLPISCFIFVVNLVAIMKKINKGDMETGLNTGLATIGLILIVAAIIFTHGS